MKRRSFLRGVASSIAAAVLLPHALKPVRAEAPTMAPGTIYLRVTGAQSTIYVKTGDGPGDWSDLLTAIRAVPGDRITLCRTASPHPGAMLTASIEIV